MNKKLTILLILTALLSRGALQAQTGETAVATAEAASDSQWQNWTFAAISIVVAAGAVYFVATDAGHHADD
jgi:hypothetical protein